MWGVVEVLEFWDSSPQVCVGMSKIKVERTFCPVFNVDIVKVYP